MIDLLGLSDEQRRNPATEAEMTTREKASGFSCDTALDPFGIGVRLPRGLLTQPDQYVLRTYSVGRKLAVDLGAFCGRSAAIMAMYAGFVVTIDRFFHWEGNPDYNLEDVTKSLSQWPNVKIVKGNVVAEVDQFGYETVDLLFVDADHNYQPVVDQICAWLPTVRPGSPVLFHDYCLIWPEVVRAVNERLADESLVEVEQRGWTLVTRKPWDARTS